MENSERYTAFISYRHCKPDSEIAAGLQKKLENYRLPKEVAKKTGRKGLGRVFRDDADLSVSDNLSEEIDKALRNSDYLIAVCSPAYLESVWCRKELDHFLKFKDRSRILLVLANGEPETAFPDVLFSDGTEPLAADCRGSDAKERKNLTDTAAIRLAAAICDVGYDDFVQRHRKEKQRRNIRRTLIAFLVMLAILMISVYFLIRISRQNAIITQRYADTLAATSANLLSDGRRIDAAYAARLGLPDHRTDTYSESASKALVKALGIYDFPGFGCDDDIKLPFSASYYFTVSPTGKYIGVCGLSDDAYIMNAETKEVNPISANSVLKSGFFDSDRGFVCMKDDGGFLYYDLSDSSVTELGFSGADISVDNKGAGYAFIDDDKISFYRGTDCLYEFHYYDVIENNGSMYRIEVDFSSDGSHAVVYCGSYSDNRSYVFSVDLEMHRVRNISLTIGGYYNLFASDDTAFVSSVMDGSNEFILFQDLDSENMHWSSVMFEHLAGLGILGDDIVAYTKYEIYIFDRDLSFKQKIISSGLLSDIEVTNDGIIIYDQGGGVHIIKDGECTRVQPAISSGNNYKEQDFSNGTLYLLRSGDNHISTYVERYSDYLTQFDGDYTEVPIYDYESPYITGLVSSVLEHENDYDESRIYDVMPCENADLILVQLWDGIVYIYDANTYECIKTIYALNGMVSSFCYDEAHDYYYISATSLEVYDKDFKNVFEIQNCDLCGFDELTGNPVISDRKGMTEYHYLVDPLSYEEIISLADESLEGYEPDERVKEEYSLE